MRPERTIARFVPSIVILLVVLLLGSAGYSFFEGWDLLHALYSTVMVISTLGLTQAPETPAGIGLTIALIVMGVGTLFYLLSQTAEIIIESSHGTRQERRMKRQISAMRGHTVVCGYGRVGRHAAAELAGQKRMYVVVDSDPEVVERARGEGCAAILGDATEDHILRAAGVERAACLLIASASDAVNVFITLTARAFNPRLMIVVRASEDSTEAKLIKAGADHVIAPETIGGKRMAALAVRPDAAGLMDNLIGSHDDSGWIEQTRVERGSSLAGRRIMDAHIYTETGATVLAIRRRDGRTILNPAKDEYIREGDVLISVGARDAIGHLEELARVDDTTEGTKA